jgi:5-bromo-4-chloroindolyl phosphate hydrolysis protein
LQEQQTAAIKELETTIEQNAAIQAQQLSGAQDADSRTQQYIQQQLDATRAQLQTLQKSLQK